MFNTILFNTALFNSLPASEQVLIGDVTNAITLEAADNSIFLDGSAADTAITLGDEDGAQYIEL